MTGKPSTRPPNVASLELPELLDTGSSALTAHEAYDAVRVADADLAGRDLSGTSFTECELIGWSANETSLRSIRMLQVRVVRLNAPVLLARRSRLREVEITDSRIGSAELYDAELSGVTVTDSRLGWVNLRGTTLRDVVFRRCRFEELDLSGADVERVAFEHCTADRLTLATAKVGHFDLRGLEMSGIDGVDGLRGATISDAQLAGLGVHLAEYLGIRVED